MEYVEMIATSHTKEKSILDALHSLRELEANEALTDEMRKVLADMESQLSAMNITESGTSRCGNNFDEMKEELKLVEEKIMDMESKNSIIWEWGHEPAMEYIEAVKKVICLKKRLRGLSSKGVDGYKDMISQAENVLQVAGAKLEEELVYLLVNKRQSCEGEGDDDDDGDGDEPGGVVLDLIEPYEISFIELIKNTLFEANFDKEFCLAYTRVQKEALEECLVGIGMETLSIDELLKMKWDTLDSKIKTWVQVMKTAVQEYLGAEYRFCNRIFGGDVETASSIFANTAKSCMVCLLNFGHGVSLWPHKPETLFNLLDMYETMIELQREVNALFLGEDGSFIRTEYSDVLERIGDSARATFFRFGDEILSDPSNDPFPGGGVHPLSSYVMNYIIVYLPDYCKTLNLLLLVDKHHKGSNDVVRHQAMNEDSDCVLGFHLRSITNKLISNLEKKTQLYKDAALQNVFLINNIHYIKQKVMGSEVRKFFGDKWIRTQIANYQTHATSYVRATWSSVVSCLKDEGISGSGSGVKAIIKERIRLFSVGFEEVYRNQTGWIIKDEQLKEELRINTSQKVILAYQSFIGRHTKYDIEKYIKYDSEDLEELLRDFFEGSQKSLHYSRRRYAQS